MALRDRDRADVALKQVCTKKSATDKDKYKTWLVKLPTHLHVNGLGQTVAFYLADGPGTPKAEICQWLEEWLLGQGGVYEKASSDERSSKKGKSLLIGRITGGNDSEYRRASAEARAFSLWLKRFAEAFLRPDKDDKKDET